MKSREEGLFGAEMPLGQQINIATRTQHQALNRLITSRLPLCLPPNATTPAAYAQGMRNIAAVFEAVESVWDQVTSISASSSMSNTWASLNTLPHPAADGVPREVQFLDALRAVRPQGLARSERLRNDLEYLRHLCDFDNHLSGAKPSRFSHHVLTTVASEPHLLLAYGWCLYGAVFSGGRHIRSALCRTGPEFWSGSRPDTRASELLTAKPARRSWLSWISPTTSLPQVPSPDASEKPASLESRKPLGVEDCRALEPKGLSFWFFPGNDGEDIQAAFKDCFSAIEPLLSDEQVEDIINESQFIFSQIEELVGLIEDQVAATETSDEDGASVDDMLEESASAVSLPEGPLDELEASMTAPLTAAMTNTEDKAPILQQDMPRYLGLFLVLGCVSGYTVYNSSWW